MALGILGELVGWSHSKPQILLGWEMLRVNLREQGALEDSRGSTRRLVGPLSFSP